jgi:hypothetical protein
MPFLLITRGTCLDCSPELLRFKFYRFGTLKATRARYYVLPLSGEYVIEKAVASPVIDDEGAGKTKFDSMVI